MSPIDLDIPGIGTAGPEYAEKVNSALQDLEDAVNGQTAGTLEQMQAITPDDGQRFYVIHQGVDYIGEAGAWVRTTGNRKDIWVTDYGWKCDNQPASAGGNVTAYNAALVAARAAADSTTGGHKRIFIPEAPGFTTAYVDAALNFEHVEVIGVGGTQKANFTYGSQVRVAHVGAAVGTAAVFEVAAVRPGIHGGTLRNLYLTGYSKGVRIRNSSNVLLDNVGINVTSTALARNHPLEIENSFWLRAEGFSCETFDTARYSIGIYATNGGPVAGIAEAYFRDGVLSYGSIYFENQLVAGAEGNSSGNVVLENVVTENQGNTTYLTVRSTGTTSHGFDNWRFVNAGIFDSVGSSAFFDFDSDNKLNFIRFFIEGGASATYLIKSIGHTSLGGWEIDSLSSTQTLFDPASSTTNVYGIKVADRFGHGHAVRSNMAAAEDAAIWSTGVTDSGYRVGKAIGDTHARGMWRSSDARLSWGPGNTLHDLALGRAIGGVLAITNPLSPTVPTSLRFSPNGAQSGQIGLSNDSTIAWRNAGNTADIDVLKVTAANTTNLSGSAVSILTTGGSSINLAPNSATVAQATTNGLKLIDGKDLELGTGTGAKIGRTNAEKLAFLGATPVAQQVLPTGAGRTVDDVITFLQTVGLCKQA